MSTREGCLFKIMNHSKKFILDSGAMLRNSMLLESSLAQSSVVKLCQQLQKVPSLGENAIALIHKSRQSASILKHCSTRSLSSSLKWSYSFMRISLSAQKKRHIPKKCPSLRLAQRHNTHKIRMCHAIKHGHTDVENVLCYVFY